MIEQQHVSLPNTMNINGVTCDSIDFRFEDWGKGAHPDSDVLIPVISGSKWLMIDKSFSAPLEDGTYLNVANNTTPSLNLTLDQWKAMRAKGQLPAAKKNETQKVVVSREAMNDILDNPYWFRFAVCLLGSKTVKKPEWDRDKAATIGSPPLVPAATPVKIA